MNALEIIASVYGFIVLVLVWRNAIITNRARAHLLITKGIKTDFTSFIPLILKDSFSWPLSILWNGLKQFLKELE